MTAGTIARYGLRYGLIAFALAAAFFVVATGVQNVPSVVSPK